MKKSVKNHLYSTLITDIASLVEQGRKTAVWYVNTALVATYWLMCKIYSEDYLIDQPAIELFQSLGYFQTKFEARVEE